jgi:aminoglycoside phosphotransferase (APT) family kinase protein
MTTCTASIRSAHELCQRAFPGLANLTVEQSVEIGTGWECEIRALTVTGERLGRAVHLPLISRAFPVPNGAEKAQREFTVLTWLARQGYPVPRVYALAIEGSPPGTPIILMERIAGQPMGRAFADASPDERGRLVALFTRLLTDLHALDWCSLTADPDSAWQPLALDAWIARIAHASQRFALSELEPVLSWLRKHRGTVGEEVPVLTHGDFHPWNVLMPAPSLGVVIDWTNAAITDFRLDLAWSLLLIRSAEPSLCDAVARAYERQTRRPLEQLAYFEVAAAARRLVSIMATARHGAAAAGMRSGIEEVIRRDWSHLTAACALIGEHTGLILPSPHILLGKTSD